VLAFAELAARDMANEVADGSVLYENDVVEA
jgi:hypothetical protein